MSATRAVTSCFSLGLGLFGAAVLVAGHASAQVPASPESQPVADAGSVGGEDIHIATHDKWVPEPELALSLLPNFLKTVALDELGGQGGAAAYVGKQQAATYVTWVKASKVADDSAKQARALLDRMRNEPMNASEDKSEIKQVNYKEQRIGAAIDARMVWRHLGNETITRSRALVWLNADKHLRVVRAECVFSEENADEASPLCGNALASLRADDIENKTAVEIGFVPPADAAGAAPARTADADEDASGPSLSTAGPKNGVLFKNDNPPKRGKTRTWIFIFGAILIVFAFWSISQRKSGSGPPDNGSDGNERGREEEE